MDSNSQRADWPQGARSSDGTKRALNEHYNSYYYYYYYYYIYYYY